MGNQVKIKNIFLNLKDNEEIIYTSKPFFSAFFEVLFLSLAILLCTGFYIVKTFNIFLAGNIDIILPYTLILLLFLFSCFILYKTISDYFFTEIILTNKRFIISRFNKVKFINHEQIKRIAGYSSYSRRLITLSIILKNKKLYNFLFFDYKAIRDIFKKLHPDYNDSTDIAKDEKKGYILLVILLVIIAFFKYSEFNNNQKIENSNKTQNKQIYSKEPYFEAYMANLQKKIKGNWKPPKNSSAMNVTLLFSVDRNGNIFNPKVTKSSNDLEFDNSALEALKKSNPLPPLPTDFKGEKIDIQFGFDYNVHNVLRHNR